MTKIDAGSQVLLLLQQQLERLSKGRAKRAKPAPVGTPPAMERLRAIAERQGISDESFRRALIRGVLEQQLGEAIVTDPAFEAISRDVTRILLESSEGQELLARAMEQLDIGSLDANRP